jgi:hypothetical protein
MSYKIQFENEYTFIDQEATSFEDLPEIVQEDLITWFNLQDQSETDRESLFNLYMNNKFKAWNCPECGERVYYGNPASWDNFQGVLNQDWSYFGNRDKFTEEYLEAMCDVCRCHR